MLMRIMRLSRPLVDEIRHFGTRPSDINWVRAENLGKLPQAECDQPATSCHCRGVTVITDNVGQIRAESIELDKLGR